MQYTTNLGLNKPDPNDYADIAKINENMDKIDALVLMAVAAAAAYDPEGSYAVGDYCTHGGKLHKCNTPINDGEAWNAEHWTETSVAAELAEVHDLLAPLSGATTAQAALAALGAGVRPNLLDNAIFVGGGTDGNLPVNQIGQTSYSAGQGFIDRWKIADNQTSIEIVEDGIIIRNSKTNQGNAISIIQTLPNALNNDAFTMSCVVTEMIGVWYLACDSFSETNFPISIGITEGIIQKEDAILSGNHLYLFKGSAGANDYIKIKAVKIERGIGQTLAYQDSEGTVHLLPQLESDYATQLLKCQSYQFNVLSGDEYGIIGNGLGENANGAYIFVPTPTTLRRKPSLLFSGSFKLASDEAPPYDSMVITDIAVERYTNHGVTLICKAPEGKSITLGKPYSLWVTGDPDALFLFDANIV